MTLERDITQINLNTNVLAMLERIANTMGKIHDLQILHESRIKKLEKKLN